MLLGVFLFDVLEPLEALVGKGECLAGDLLGLEVELAKSFLSVVLFAGVVNEGGEFFGGLLALDLDVLELGDVLLELELCGLEVDLLLLHVFLIGLLVLLVGGVALVLEDVLVPEEALHDWSQLGEGLLQVLVDGPVLLDLLVLLPEVDDGLGGVGVEAFGVHGGH